MILVAATTTSLLPDDRPRALPVGAPLRTKVGDEIVALGFPLGFNLQPTPGNVLGVNGRRGTGYSLAIGRRPVWLEQLGEPVRTAAETTYNLKAEAPGCSR